MMTNEVLSTASGIKKCAEKVSSELSDGNGQMIESRSGHLVH